MTTPNIALHFGDQLGYSACAGVCDAGWFGGVLVMDGRDKEFLPVPEDMDYGQAAAYARRWSELTVNPRREIRLVLPEAAGVHTRCVASAERIEGPVAPREPVDTPTLAWIERRDEQWHLVVFENDTVRTILSRNTMLRCPQIANSANGLVLAFESDTGPVATRVEMVDVHGAVLYQTAGREPVLRAAGKGVCLCTEPVRISGLSAGLRGLSQRVSIVMNITQEKWRFAA